MAKKTVIRPHGQVRRSQIVTTFGPGAMMDLPDHSILVSGLDQWTGVNEEIIEPRLLQKLKEHLDVQNLRMFAPPRTTGDAFSETSGVVGWQFPEWFVTQDVRQRTAAAGHTIRSRRLVHRDSLTRGRYVDESRKSQNVVPVRFVRACRHGHIGDIDWIAFVHGEDIGCRAGLWMDDVGTSGDITEIQVRCECGRTRLLSEAVETVGHHKAGALGLCDGLQPWLGPGSKSRCEQPSRFLIRTASNAYFPQKLAVISLPPRNESVSKAVEQVWMFLEAAESADDVRYERRKERVARVLEGITDAEVWGEIERRRNPTVQTASRLKPDELKTLISCEQQRGDDRQDGDFLARVLPKSVWDAPWMSSVQQVVLVHRLREVVAQAGFTRFEAASTTLEGELEIGVQPALLAREITWVPAIENRGEGIFLHFRTEAIEEWARRPDVLRYAEGLQEGFDLWKSEHRSVRRVFPHVQYYMLHSLSHLLITAISLECGYPASSIRERIYAFDDEGYGILLYTGSSDSEGTLGGLVQEGRRIHEHMRQALTQAELCSNDPVCSQHQSNNLHERRFLHGAACHGCLLIAETSCEQQNDYLDRALVVPTVENHGVEFFQADL
ncbi:hypothetical protein LBMAG46_41570 [Planctomycetia bacterium]|nr:hypothetical protein LBMAG46_41570 [Planctomycetia bacterium]